MTITTDLFSYLPGLQVSPNEILESELFCQQVLQAQFPDTDWRQGTGVTDMVIRPSATLLALINKALIFYFSQNTLASVTNDTSTSIVDSLLSNWFITRNQGSASVINARLYFAVSKNVILNTSTYFSPDNVLRFYPSGSLAFNADQMSLDIPSNSWYIDVDLVAETPGSGYDISSGSLLYFTTFDTYFLHAEINYLSATSISSESNLDFVKRTSDSISTRNLINNPSISSNLLENFSLITEVASKGLGDPEMIRDLSLVTPPFPNVPIWVHTGGMVDVYCRVPLTTNTLQFVTDVNGKVYIPGPNYKGIRSGVTGGIDVDTMFVTHCQALPNTFQITVDSTNGLVLFGNISIEGAAPGNNTLNTQITAISGSLITVADKIWNTLSDAVVGPAYVVSNPNFGQASGVSLNSGSNTTNTFAFSPFAEVSFAGLVISGTTGLATATRPDHGITPGRYVTISGATPTGYNGTFKVLSSTKDTFTYEIAPSVTGAATGIISLFYVVPNSDIGFSSRQQLLYDFGTGQANKTVSLSLHSFQGLDGIQNYLSSKSNKVLAADLLARGFNLCMLDIEIVGYTGVAPSSALSLSLTQNYLSSLVPGQVFVMSDLLSTLYSGGITTIKTPISITYNIYTRDLVPPISGTITDTLNTRDSTNIFMVNSISTSSENV